MDVDNIYIITLFICHHSIGTALSSIVNYNAPHQDSLLARHSSSKLDSALAVLRNCQLSIVNCQLSISIGSVLPYRGPPPSHRYSRPVPV